MWLLIACLENMKYALQIKLTGPNRLSQILIGCSFNMFQSSCCLFKLLWADSRWWNCKHFWNFHPDPCENSWSSLTWAYFSNGLGWNSTTNFGQICFPYMKTTAIRWSSSARRGGFDAEKICDNLERLGRLGCTKFGTPKTPVNAADDRPTPMKWMKPIGFQDSIWWDM